VDVERAIGTRRTHKLYGRQPVDRATLEEIFALARFAPNHHLTQPWRFRVLGPETLAGLKASGGPKEAAKLERAPTLVVASAVLSGDPIRGRGGPRRDRVRGLHRPARGPRARPRLVLAHPQGAA